MPQAALPSQRTINDAARPELLKSPGISGHPIACHHLAESVMQGLKMIIGGGSGEWHCWAC
jgi:hypothetical protein